MNEIESTDREILALLSRDGRMSYTDLGKALGLSTSAAQQRVRRLEQRGLITGFRAVIDPALLGCTLLAFISVMPHDPTDDESIPAEVAKFSEVVSCHSVAGDASYLLQVQVATPSDLDHLLTRMRRSAKISTTTTVVLHTHFSDRPLVGPPTVSVPGDDEPQD